MKTHANVRRTWTLIIPTDTMPAVNNPKGMNQFLRELTGVVSEFHENALVGVTGDYIKRCVYVTFRYYKTAAEFADMWFHTRAKVLAEMRRNRHYLNDAGLE